MTDGWIVIPNWDKFQHYKDRDPVWIKLYLELNSRDDWRRLTFATTRPPGIRLDRIRPRRHPAAFP